MKKSILAVALLAGASFAYDNSESKVSLGVDFSQPYVLQNNGADVNNRSNMNVGVDARVNVTEGLNLGGRFSFDAEEKAGTTRRMAFAPGAQYRWYTNETFNPYIRFDVPVTFRGAAPEATSGNSAKDTKDVGLAGGLGLAWNILQNTVLRYDFNVQYDLGVGNAEDVLSVEFFKVGLDYRF